MGDDTSCLCSFGLRNTFYRVIYATKTTANSALEKAGLTKIIEHLKFYVAVVLKFRTFGNTRTSVVTLADNLITFRQVSRDKSESFSLFNNRFALILLGFIIAFNVWWTPSAARFLGLVAFIFVFGGYLLLSISLTRLLVITEVDFSFSTLSNKALYQSF